jgi:hypothetical protein
MSGDYSVARFIFHKHKNVERPFWLQFTSCCGDLGSSRLDNLVR